MNQFYKKFEHQFSEDGELEFYAKIEKMKNELKFINANAKENVQKNIENMVNSYEKILCSMC
jgi:hypothetical protein